MLTWKILSVCLYVRSCFFCFRQPTKKRSRQNARECLVIFDDHSISFTFLFFISHVSHAHRLQQSFILRPEIIYETDEDSSRKDL